MVGYVIVVEKIHEFSLQSPTSLPISHDWSIATVPTHIPRLVTTTVPTHIPVLVNRQRFHPIGIAGGNVGCNRWIRCRYWLPPTLLWVRWNFPFSIFHFPNNNDYFCRIIISRVLNGLVIAVSPIILMILIWSLLIQNPLFCPVLQWNIFLQ